MITILDLAKKCSCDPATIRKWIKKYKVETQKVKASNGKTVQAISKACSEKFASYWEEITTLPDDMVTIPDVAKRNNVDRKTVRLWTERNNVELRLLRSSVGPPTKAMSLKDGEKFFQEYNTPQCIPILDILKEYNTDWRVIKRWAKNNNCEFVKTFSNHGGRTKYSISKEDAKRLEKYLMDMKSDGFFYLIQPIPEFNLNRIKLGFTKKPSRRLKEHKTVCPNAKLVKKWKCKKDDETSVIKRATSEGCTQIYTEINNRKTATEVFDCENYQIVLERLERILS